MAKKRSILGTTFYSIMDGQVIDGTADADTMTSTHNMTTLNGGGGNDTLTTTVVGHPDELYAFQDGGTGNDTMTFNGRTNYSYLGAVLNGGTGDDVITVSAGIGRWADPYRNVLLETYALGGAGNDRIAMNAEVHDWRGTVWQEAYGGGGDDDIRLNLYVRNFNSSHNYVEGGSGNDTIVVVFETGLSDDYDYNAHYNEIYGGDGDDIITTYGDFDAVTDYLYGGAGNDILRTTSLNDGNELYGGDGDDRLHSGYGADYMEGGSGADTFVLDGANGSDRIGDFAPGIDRIYSPGLTLEGIALRIVGSDTSVTITTDYGVSTVLLVGVIVTDPALLVA